MCRRVNPEEQKRQKDSRSARRFAPLCATIIPTGFGLRLSFCRFSLERFQRFIVLITRVRESYLESCRPNGLGFGISLGIRHSSFVIPLLVLVGLMQLAPAQDSPLSSSLSRARFRSGEETLRGFVPVSYATRHSIVKLNVDGETVALGAVMDANGLVLTKAS